MREMLSFELTASGYAVAVVDDGRSALGLLAERPFDLVIVDLNMPDLGGVELVREFKACAPEVEIVVVSGAATVEAVIASLKAGALDFIQKPFDINELRLSVGRALERARLRGAAALYDACQELLKLDDGDGLALRAVELARRALGCDQCGLLVGSPERSTLTVSMDASAERALIERLGSAAIGASSPIFHGAEALKEGAWSSAAVYPLAVAERAIGALVMLRASALPGFDERERSAAAIFSTQLSLALDNARLAVELKGRLAALEEARSRLAISERLAAIGQVAAGVVHEVNNPASYILTNLVFIKEGVAALREVGEAIERGESAAEIAGLWAREGGAASLQELAEAVSDAYDGSLRIKDIVRDMRSLASSGEGVDSTYDLREVLRTSLRVVGPQLVGVAQVTMDLVGSVEVRGNASRMIQVFINLLVNAAQAIEQCPRSEPRIAVTGRRQSGRVEIRVADNGPGMSPEVQARAFEAFFTTKGAGKGTGLGLAITREIVEAQGGQLSVESTSPEGTVFLVSLPSASLTSNITGDFSGLQAGVSRLRPHVLFIDEDPVMQRTFARTFASRFKPLSAVSGEAALRAIDEDAPDAIVCAMPMPGLDTPELMRCVSGKGRGLIARVIFVADSTSWEPRLASGHLLENPVLPRPLDIEQLRVLLLSMT